MRRIYEFKCRQGHVTEKYIDESIRNVQCSVCEQDAIRIVSNQSSIFMIDGFPSGIDGDAWVRKRQEKARKEASQATEG